MPTYSYACTECDDRFDAVQAFSDEALTTCAKCEGRLRKLFNSVGVVFKGSGFYRTDSRDSGKGSSKAPNSGSDSSGAGSSGSDSSGSKGTEKSSSGETSSGSSDKSTNSAPAAAAAASS